MKNYLENKTVQLVLGVMFLLTIIIVIIYYNTYNEKFTMSLEDDVKENFHNNEDLMKEQNPVRIMWNHSNITNNASYDLRGEIMRTEKEPVSIINNSELENNLTNERVF